MSWTGIWPVAPTPFVDTGPLDHQEMKPTRGSQSSKAAMVIGRGIKSGFRPPDPAATTPAAPFSIQRFQRPVCDRNMPDALVSGELKGGS